MDLFTLASSIGLSAPLTLLALGVLHHAGAAPTFFDATVASHPRLASPLVLSVAALLFLFEVLAAKSKLTKPLKAVWDLAQVVVKPVATALLGLAVIDARFTVEAPATVASHGPAVLQAALLPLPDLAGVHLPAFGAFELALAIAVTLLVHLVRAGADLVVWVSPIPLIDAFVSTLADLHAFVMIGTALLFPRVAAVLCALQLLVCLAVAARMLRVLRAFLHLGAGTLRGGEAPADAPPRAVAVHAAGAAVVCGCAGGGGPGPRWAPAWAWAQGAELHVAVRRRFRWRFASIPVAAGAHVALADGLLSRELAVRHGARVVVTVRFARDRAGAARALADALSRAGAPLDDATAGGLRLPAAARAAAAR